MFWDCWARSSLLLPGRACCCVAILRRLSTRCGISKALVRLFTSNAQGLVQRSAPAKLTYAWRWNARESAYHFMLWLVIANGGGYCTANSASGPLTSR